MVAGMVQLSPSAIFLMVPRRIFPDRVVRQTADDDGELEGCHRSEPFADQRHDLLFDLGRLPRHARLQDQEAAGHLALDCILDAKHGAFGNIGAGRENLLHAAGRQTMAGDIDDVVGAAHDVEVAI